MNIGSKYFIKIMQADTPNKINKINIVFKLLFKVKRNNKQKPKIDVMKKKIKLSNNNTDNFIKKPPPKQ